MKKLMLALALLSPTSASAQEVTLGRPGQTQVLVWRDRAAFKEGLALIRAGMLDKNQQLIIDQLACFLPVGAKAAVVERDGGLVRIVVTSGDQEGCRGLVTMEDVP